MAAQGSNGHTNGHNTNGHGACCHAGPGYATPLDATKGPRETLLYVPCVVPDGSRPDYLATVDVDPASLTFSQVIHRCHLARADEPHHSGWNACSSCHGNPSKQRKYLVLPTLGSGRVYGIDTASDPRAPKVAHVVEREEIVAKTGLSYLHTSHCLGSGEIMISAMGDAEGHARGGFVLLDEQFKVKGTWGSETTPYGYDFWYQPRHNMMVSSGWGAPLAFTKGFDPSQVGSHYNSKLFFWDWSERKVTQTVDLGPEGLIPLEVRMLHDPASTHGYVGAALSSNVIHFTKDASGQCVTKVAVHQPWLKVEGWVLPEMPPLITDILISLDDRFLYFSNWLRGDICQYDISDPQNPRLAGRIWLGGAARKGSGVSITGGLPEGAPNPPAVPVVRGAEVQGGPQMLQLSLDGTRLYVTNSLYSAWDAQFYPGMVARGSHMLRVLVDTAKGGLVLDEDFLVDFGQEPGGAVLAHEVRYPGGDCSSDIWV